MPGASSNPIDLLFGQPAATDANLVFGADFIGPPSAVTVTVQAALPLPTVAIQVVPVVTVQVAATLPGLVLAAEVRYESRTQRPTVGKARTSFQGATVFHTGLNQPHQDSPRLPTGWAGLWRYALATGATLTHRLPPTLERMHQGQAEAFARGLRTHSAMLWRHQDAWALWLHRRSGFDNTCPVRHATLFRHQDADRTRRASLRQRHRSARRVGGVRASSFQSAAPMPRAWRTRFQDAVPPPPGISLLIIGEPDGPICYTPDGHLLFAQLMGETDSHLRFVCEYHMPQPPAPPEGPVVVSVQRVYIVINNLSLRRVSDNAVVPAFQFGLSLDVASWTWGFTASLPATSQALVEPTTGPVELRAFVNGTEFRVLAEQVGRERAFGQAAIRISGRGRNAVLDAPYSPAQVFSNASGRTHQQLFDDVLTFNGIPLGYAIDYALEAWAVPAGVWNHQGTYISALNTLAQAGGAYLIPHPSALGFKVRHLYPTAPWHWGTVTPDFVLPSAVVTREGLTWHEKPAYNRVFVSGVEQGVLGRVTRQGTAGEILAPMVTDPLITTASAARQRGLAVLGDTGKQVEHQLRLPVLASTGIIQPGAFVQYNDNGASRIGIVRGTQVEAQMPDVWQSLSVEVHEYA